MKTFQTVVWVVTAVMLACADEQPFTRYQSIIDRKPFGPEPANFDPEALPGTASGGDADESGEMTPEQRTAEEQQLASSVRVSILNVRPSGEVAVGFTDTSANPVENYYLTVGRSQNGWTVKAANPANETVTLAKDGIEVTVKLGESTGGGGKGGGKGGAKRTPVRAAAPVAHMGGGGPGPAHPGIGGLARLRMRRQEEEERNRADAARKAAAEAEEKAEREEREARAAEEKQRDAEERAQQREALLQIQEQLKKAREEREAREAQQRQSEDGQSEDNDTE